MTIDDTRILIAAGQHCIAVRPDETYEGKQGLNYFAGISAESVGAQGVCMHLLKMPPGARAKAHLHAHHETAIYLISGEVEVLHGSRRPAAREAHPGAPDRHPRRPRA